MIVKPSSLQVVEIDSPIILDHDNQFIDGLEIIPSKTFIGDYLVYCDSKAGPKNRLSFPRISNCLLRGDKRDIGGIFLKQASGALIHGTTVSGCGGCGIAGEDLWNARISDTTVVNCGWALPLEHASLLLYSNLGGNDATNDIHISNCILERGPRQCIFKRVRAVEIATTKLHNVPEGKPNYVADWPALWMDDCSGAFTISAMLSWTSISTPIRYSGTQRPRLYGELAFPNWREDL